MTNFIQYYITIIVDLLWIFLTILFLICLNRNVPTTKGRHFYNSVTLSKEQMKIMSNLTVPRHTFHIPQKYISKHRCFMLTLFFFINNPFLTHPFTPHTKNIKKTIHITPRRNVIALWKKTQSKKQTKKCKIPFYYQIQNFLGKNKALGLWKHKDGGEIKLKSYKV